MWWDDLPSEITDDILHRLPVKTLIICTSLSKSFLSLITSRAFISAHIALHANSHLLLRYLSDDKREMYHLEPDNDAFSGFLTQGISLPFRDFTGNWFSIVGSVNGVICLVNDCEFEGTCIILWNPSIRKCVRAPRPLYVYDKYGPYESVCGFGYDSVSDDYKVVRVVKIDGYSERNKIEVYSLRTRCWKPVGASPGPGPGLYLRGRRGYVPCFLRGSVHWVGVQYVREGGVSPSKSIMVIFKFDLSLERYEIMGVPDILEEREMYLSHSDCYVQECFGTLTLIIRDYYGASNLNVSSIWVMKEYGVVESWTKIICFDFGHSRPYDMPRACGFRKNGNVIMVVGKMSKEEEAVNNVIVSIDLKMNTEKLLREVTTNGCSFYMSTYVESMVLFKEGKGSDDLTEEIEEMNDQLEDINIETDAEEEDRNGE